MNDKRTHTLDEVSTLLRNMDDASELPFPERLNQLRFYPLSALDSRPKDQPINMLVYTFENGYQVALYDGGHNIYTSLVPPRNVSEQGFTIDVVKAHAAMSVIAMLSRFDLMTTQEISDLWDAGRELERKEHVKYTQDRIRAAGKRHGVPEKVIEEFCSYIDDFPHEDDI